MQEKDSPKANNPKNSQGSKNMEGKNASSPKTPVFVSPAPLMKNQH